MTFKYPRGICKVCGREVRVRHDGTLQGHGGSTAWDRPWCSGSWEKGWKVGEDGKPLIARP